MVSFFPQTGQTPPSAAVSAGDGVVIVTLSRPDSSLPALLDIPIVKSGTEESLTPVGTGPYYFTTDEAGACLASHSGWWRGESRPAERIALSAARDREAILYQFSSHEVQLITADLIGTEPITATGNISYEDADTTVLQFLGFNTARAPFQDSAARRALDAVRRALEALETGMTPDAVLTDAEEALDALGELTGRTAKEEIVSRIFSRFCVGK